MSVLSLSILFVLPRARMRRSINSPGEDYRRANANRKRRRGRHLRFRQFFRGGARHLLRGKWNLRDAPGARAIVRNSRDVDLRKFHRLLGIGESHFPLTVWGPSRIGSFSEPACCTPPRQCRYRGNAELRQLGRRTFNPLIGEPFFLAPAARYNRDLLR